MPYISKHERARGGWTAADLAGVPEDQWSDVERLSLRTIPGPDQGSYGTATTDPLGREGAGWHKGKNGLPVKTKGDNA